VIWFPIFCDFYKPFIIHLVHVLSSCSSSDSGPFYDILDLADVANVFVANSVSPSVASRLSVNVLRNSTFPSRHFRRYNNLGDNDRKSAVHALRCIDAPSSARQRALLFRFGRASLVIKRRKDLSPCGDLPAILIARAKRFRRGAMSALEYDRHVRLRDAREARLHR